MKSFLICPVRGVDLSCYGPIMEKLESFGYEVHWPPRDTNQGDDTGLSICQDNMKAIGEADTIHFIWDGKSQGCLFDLGMAFALGKKIEVISIPEKTEGKSFQNMALAWEDSQMRIKL